jgi:hypothetical protein
LGQPVVDSALKLFEKLSLPPLILRAAVCSTGVANARLGDSVCKTAVDMTAALMETEGDRQDSSVGISFEPSFLADR